MHSHYLHLVALAEAARSAGLTDILVHAFTDGRDTFAYRRSGFLEDCENELEPTGARIVTVVGRYFAMDRDRRWDRTKRAWDAIVLGRGEGSAISRRRKRSCSNTRKERRMNSCRRLIFG